MPKTNRQEEVQQLVCPKCGNNKKFTGENQRKVFFQNFKYTGYRKLGEDEKEKYVVNYSPMYSEDGRMGYDVIYCADVVCVKKNGQRVEVWLKRGVIPHYRKGDKAVVASAHDDEDDND
jgi:hypothetical protein